MTTYQMTMLTLAGIIAVLQYTPLGAKLLELFSRFRKAVPVAASGINPIEQVAAAGLHWAKEGRAELYRDAAALVSKATGEKS